MVNSGILIHKKDVDDHKGTVANLQQGAILISNSSSSRSSSSSSARLRNVVLLLLWAIESGLVSRLGLRIVRCYG